jgi:outer membrane protein assembly factor BamB
MSIGYNVNTSDNEMLINNRYLYPKFYKSYNEDEIPKSEKYTCREYYNDEDIQSEIVINPDRVSKLLNVPLMDSPWPMYCHDVRHTGRSPYSTADTSNIEKWKFHIEESIWESSLAIDNEGIIYIPINHLYAIYPNGTLKWKLDISKDYWTIPAIDENGVIYIGLESGLLAVNPNGTKKWKYKTGEIISNPAIGNDGTIYFSTVDDVYPQKKGSIYAIYPNGTLRWRHKVNSIYMHSSPAIGEDGTIYTGKGSKLYALYPNNGTLKWEYKTGKSITVSPCIADDGTIYVVSLDSYLHAVSLYGSLKWKTDVGAGTSPTIGQDGTIYCGYKKLHAIDSTDGSIKWSFNPGPHRTIRGATPCNSLDGTIYFGTDIYWETMEGGEIIALNSDGTEKWRKLIANDWVDSAPAIGADGTVYIGSYSHEIKSWSGSVKEMSYVHAFGPVKSNEPPKAPTIEGATHGTAGEHYYYKFKSHDPDNNPVRFFIDWGDGRSGWTYDYASDEIGYNVHRYNLFFNRSYTIKAKAQDTLGAESDWTELIVTMQRSKTFNINSMFYGLLEQFPILHRLLSLMRVNL